MASWAQLIGMVVYTCGTRSVDSRLRRHKCDREQVVLIFGMLVYNGTLTLPGIGPVASLTSVEQSPARRPFTRQRLCTGGQGSHLTGDSREHDHGQRRPADEAHLSCAGKELDEGPAASLGVKRRRPNEGGGVPTAPWVERHRLCRSDAGVEPPAAFMRSGGSIREPIPPGPVSRVYLRRQPELSS